MEGPNGAANSHREWKRDVSGGRAEGRATHDAFFDLLKHELADRWTGNENGGAENDRRDGPLGFVRVAFLSRSSLATPVSRAVHESISFGKNGVWGVGEGGRRSRESAERRDGTKPPPPPPGEKGS